MKQKQQGARTQFMIHSALAYINIGYSKQDFPHSSCTKFVSVWTVFVLQDIRNCYTFSATLCNFTSITALSNI